jgi:transposase
VPSMPQPAQSDQDDIATAIGEVVLGVDTHKDVHVAAVITGVGALLASRSFPTTATSYRKLLVWARTFGALRRAGVECTGSYGAALARQLRAAGIEVVEVNQPDKATRRRRGKSDPIDAEAAAEAVLSGRATATAKTGDGPVEMIRMFKLAKGSAIKSRTQAINQLKAVLVAADPALRESLSGLSSRVLIRHCAQLQAGLPSDAASAAAYTMRLLARRILELTAEIHDLNQRITHAVNRHTPKLLQRPGVGPDCAAALLIAAGDNPQRLGGEASYAALCGASPVEASSGKTRRLRLNRGGDRQANAALYRIALSRLRWDPRTRDYLARRISEGKTRREAICCLKRYIAREIYQIISEPNPDPPPHPPPLDTIRGIRPKCRYQRTARTMTSAGKRKPAKAERAMGAGRGQRGIMLVVSLLERGHCERNSAQVGDGRHDLVPRVACRCRHRAWRYRLCGYAARDVHGGRMEDRPAPGGMAHAGRAGRHYPGWYRRRAAVLPRPAHRWHRCGAPGVVAVTRELAYARAIQFFV